MNTYTLDVGWTSSRPVVPDEQESRVIVLAVSYYDAVGAAACMMACKPNCEMPTIATARDGTDGHSPTFSASAMLARVFSRADQRPPMTMPPSTTMS
jgi:hypothetical protein